MKSRSHGNESTSQPKRGLFVTLEGPDGSGKTTQGALLAERLLAEGFNVIHTREPGGTPLGRRLRQLLLAGADGGPVPVAEMLLMAADRAQHVETVIRPALAQGAVVVSDRFVDSSIAYQAGGLGLSEADVRRVNALATGGLLPDVTVLLDLDPMAGLERAGVRTTGAGADVDVQQKDGLDRIERRGPAFQSRVLATYRKLAALESVRWVRLPVADLSVEDVAEQVWAAVLPALQRVGARQ